MKPKKMIIAFLAMILFLSLLAACGGGDKFDGTYVSAVDANESLVFSGDRYTRYIGNEVDEEGVYGFVGNRIIFIDDKLTEDDNVEDRIFHQEGGSIFLDEYDEYIKK